VVSTRNVTEPGYSPWVIYFVWITDRILYYMKHGHPNKRRGAAEARRRWNVLPTIIPWDHYAGDNSYIRMVHDVCFMAFVRHNRRLRFLRFQRTSDGRVGGWWVSGCRNVLSLSLCVSGVPTFFLFQLAKQHQMVASDESKRQNNNHLSKKGIAGDGWRPRFIIH
jgi:hypothetical protein